jgi:hypothetical protein
VLDVEDLVVVLEVVVVLLSVVSVVMDVVLVMLDDVEVLIDLVVLVDLIVLVIVVTVSRTCTLSTRLFTVGCTVAVVMMVEVEVISGRKEEQNDCAGGNVERSRSSPLTPLEHSADAADTPHALMPRNRRANRVAILSNVSQVIISYSNDKSWRWDLNTFIHDCQCSRS